MMMSAIIANLWMGVSKMPFYVFAIINIIPDNSLYNLKRILS